MTTNDATEKKPLWLLIEKKSLSSIRRTYQGKTLKHRFNGLRVNLTTQVIMFRVMGAIFVN